MEAMGAYLSDPVVEKNSRDEANRTLVSASSSMQGWRVTQEDAHNMILDYDIDTSLFAVYDGHGGSEVAKYCSLKLPSFIKDTPAYIEGNIAQGLKDAFLRFDLHITDRRVVETLKMLADPESPLRIDESSDESDHDAVKDNVSDSENDIPNSQEQQTNTETNTAENRVVPRVVTPPEVIESSNESCDDRDNLNDTSDSSDSDDDEPDPEDKEFMANMIEEPGSDSGTTAVVALICGTELYVANAGDSRCVLSRKGQAIDMSTDHKPEDEQEKARIIKAGGRVTGDGRVNGGLNLSRAIGDHAYKQNKELPPAEQMITALPDIKKITLTDEDEFIVLACDGIWNFLSSQQAVDYIRSKYQDEKKLSRVIEKIFDHCLAPNSFGDGTGCDNMTAIIINLKDFIKKRQREIKMNTVQYDRRFSRRTAQSVNSSADANPEVPTSNNSCKRSISPQSDSEEQDNKKIKSGDDR